MSVLKKIAFFQNRRDEVPNQEVAQELAATGNLADIHEIAENLWNREANIRSDCLKVLYELGYLKPELIADYAGDFLKLLKERNNRLVWGGMIALSTVVTLRSDLLKEHLDEIIKTMEAGTVITNDAGMKILAGIASVQASNRANILPYLLHRLESARAVDAPRYAEVIAPAIDAANNREFIRILQDWIASSSGGRLSRLKKVLKTVETAR
jgi:hypothetical protein